MNPQNQPVQTFIDIKRSEARKLLWLLLAASILFVAGIVTPMLTLTQFIFLKNSISVLSAALELLNSGQLVLFMVVTGFSIILPVLKILVLFRLLTINPQQKHKLQPYLSLMHNYGRWAMLDVMVVAILIVTVKLGAIASIQVHAGLYIFGAAVLLIMLITHRVVHLTDKLSQTDTAADKTDT